MVAILVAVAFLISLAGAFVCALIESARRPASAFGHGTLPKNATISLILLRRTPQRTSADRTQLRE